MLFQARGDDVHRLRIRPCIHSETGHIQLVPAPNALGVHRFYFFIEHRINTPGTQTEERPDSTPSRKKIFSCYANGFACDRRNLSRAEGNCAFGRPRPTAKLLGAKPAPAHGLPGDLHMPPTFSSWSTFRRKSFFYAFRDMKSRPRASLIQRPAS